mmetsp:Transcript_3981/g.8859  ORF Transcript_3981/g.8859 Transcript_3981/m.8859 type:complete len:228 (+) Transcript_3981:1410-2093(+)
MPSAEISFPQGTDAKQSLSSSSWSPYTKRTFSRIFPYSMHHIVIIFENGMVRFMRHTMSLFPPPTSATIVTLTFSSGFTSTPCCTTSTRSSSFSFHSGWSRLSSGDIGRPSMVNEMVAGSKPTCWLQATSTFRTRLPRFSRNWGASSTLSPGRTTVRRTFSETGATDPSAAPPAAGEGATGASTGSAATLGGCCASRGGLGANGVSTAGAACCTTSTRSSSFFLHSG